MSLHCKKKARDCKEKREIAKKSAPLAPGREGSLNLCVVVRPGVLEQFCCFVDWNAPAAMTLVEKEPRYCRG